VRSAGREAGAFRNRIAHSLSPFIAIARKGHTMGVIHSLLAELDEAIQSVRVTSAL